MGFVKNTLYIYRSSKETLIKIYVSICLYLLEKIQKYKYNTTCNKTSNKK